MKKIFLKLLSIITTIILIISTSSITSFSDNNITGQELMRMMDNQQHALAANELLMDCILNENGDYPDYYGGVYIADNNLHIQFTVIPEYEESRVRNILEEFINWVSFDYVNYAYNELYSIAEDITENFNSENYLHKIIGYHVDVIKNASVITVPDVKTKYLLQKYISNEDIKYPIIIEMSEPAIPCSTGGLISDNKEESTRTIINLEGGMQINNSSYWFTLGYCGTYTSLNAFVTCGHAQDASTWTLLGNSIGNGSILGAPSFIRFQNNYSGDFSIHNIASGTGNTINITNKIQNVSSAGTSANGDSGGPWFVYNSGSWKIAGIHSGVGGSNLYFTPWKYISAAGFTAKTS